MSFKEKLSKILGSKLPKKDITLLPSSCRFIGRIVILKLPQVLLKKKKIIGRALLELFPYMRTVCIEKNISTFRREPKIEVIAGARKTETILTEHGCRFLLDPAKVMFSVGNKFEKERLMKICMHGETIVDMFAGIGYWTIPIAKFCIPKKIFAVDKNKIAVRYLDKNCRLNKVSNKVEILEGDCRKFSKLLAGRADRIIMGWIFGTEKFLPAALEMAGEKCTIHFHRVCHLNELKKIKRKILLTAKIQNHEIKFLGEREVKTYSPRRRHYVIDFLVSKS